MRNWKTPLDRHLKCAFQIMHRDVIWRTHGPKYHLSNFNSKCAFRIKLQNTHFAVVWKHSKPQLICSIRRPNHNARKLFSPWYMVTSNFISWINHEALQYHFTNFRWQNKHRLTLPPPYLYQLLSLHLQMWMHSTDGRSFEQQWIHSAARWN